MNETENVKPITEIKKLINDCKLAEGLAKSIIIQCKKLPISYLFNGFFFELAHKWIFGDDQSNDLNNRDHSIFNHEFKIVWNTEFIDWEDYDLDYIAVKDELERSAPYSQEGLIKYKKLHYKTCAFAKLLFKFENENQNKRVLKEGLNLLKYKQAIYRDIRLQDSDLIKLYLKKSDNTQVKYFKTKNLKDFEMKFYMIKETNREIFEASKRYLRLPPIKEFGVSEVENNDRRMLSFLQTIPPNQLDEFTLSGEKNDYYLEEKLLNIGFYFDAIKRICSGVTNMVYFNNCRYLEFTL